MPLSLFRAVAIELTVLGSCVESRRSCAICGGSTGEGISGIGTKTLFVPFASQELEKMGHKGNVCLRERRTDSEE